MGRQADLAAVIVEERSTRSIYMYMSTVYDMGLHQSGYIICTCVVFVLLHSGPKESMLDLTQVCEKKP